MNNQTPTSVQNWSKLHELRSEEKRKVIFEDNKAKELNLSFCFRCSLKDNAFDLKKYLKIVSEWDSDIEHIENNGMELFDVIGTTNQGKITEERLIGWLHFSIEISHEFGCWLQSWDVANES